MKASLIVAMDENGLIGNGDQLPWKIPSDLKRFKLLTTSCSVIMGRKTFESLKMPKGLPNRYNFVLSSSDNGIASFTCYTTEGLNEGLYRISSLDEAIKEAMIPYRETFIIGGARVYEEALNKDYVNRVYLTRVRGVHSGDVYFPAKYREFWNNGFDEVVGQTYSDGNGKYDFIIFERKR